MNYKKSVKDEGVLKIKTWSADSNLVVTVEDNGKGIPEEIRLRADKTGAVIPHTYLRLKKDRELILDFIQECSTDTYLSHIFDFSRFESWLDALLERLRG